MTNRFDTLLTTIDDALAASRSAVEAADRVLEGTDYPQQRAALVAKDAAARATRRQQAPAPAAQA